MWEVYEHRRIARRVQRLLVEVVDITAHDGRSADALIQRALDKLGLMPEDLAGLRKSDVRKQAITG